LEERTVVEVCRHERQLTAQLLDGVAGLPRLRVYGPKALAERVGVVSLTIEGMDPQELAAVLDDSFGIETRAGLHCAPGAHRCLGTFAGGGTLRLSPGAFNTAAEIDAAVCALRQLATA
jgi:selenocysteine lyase/cysteine desulfurase